MVFYQKVNKNASECLQMSYDHYNYMYEGVSKSSCTKAITFLWYNIPYQKFFHVLNRYVSSSDAKFQQVASKYNKFMKL